MKAPFGPVRTCVSSIVAGHSADPFHFAGDWLSAMSKKYKLSSDVWDTHSSKLIVQSTLLSAGGAPANEEG